MKIIMVINGAFVIRSVLYLIGFTLGVTFGSWLAFSLFLNDSPSLFRRHSSLLLGNSEDGVARRYHYSNNEDAAGQDGDNKDAVSVDILKMKFKSLTDGGRAGKNANLKILCLVVFVTGDVARLRAVNNTFGGRCAKTLFYSPSYKARGFDVVWIDSEYAGYGSWQFFRKMLNRLLVDIGEESYDWLIHTDDKTYLIYDNLKLFLRQFRSGDALFIGNLQSSLIFDDYVVHHAGFVVSNATLGLLGKHMDRRCQGFWYPTRFEYALYKCMRSLGVQTVDGVDSTKGGHRFLPSGPKDLFGKAQWSLKWQDPSKCCSDTAISFGQLSTKEFYMLEYILYKLEPVGIVRM